MILIHTFMYKHKHENYIVFHSLSVELRIHSTLQWFLSDVH